MRNLNGEKQGNEDRKRPTNVGKHYGCVEYLGDQESQHDAEDVRDHRVQAEFIVPNINVLAKKIREIPDEKEDDEIDNNHGDDEGTKDGNGGF